MITQPINLFPHKMAVENIMLPLQQLLGYTAEDAYKEAMFQLERAGLEAKAGGFSGRGSGDV